MRPDSGGVEILGHDILRHPERAARILAYLGQESTALDELTVSLAVETTARLRGLDVRQARAERDGVLEELALTPLAARPLKKLSGGQRRLACFATALVGERPLLVLDEPTTGMDPIARRAVWGAVDRRRAERGTTVLLVTHNVIEAETVLDRVAVLDHGKVIACDTPAGLKEQVAGEVRVELVWRDRAPLDVPEVAALRSSAVESGRLLVAAARPRRGAGCGRGDHRRGRFRVARRLHPGHAQPGGRLPCPGRECQGAGKGVMSASRRRDRHMIRRGVR